MYHADHSTCSFRLAFIPYLVQKALISPSYRFVKRFAWPFKNELYSLRLGCWQRVSVRSTSMGRVVEAGSETSGSECSILMMLLTSIRMEQPSFQFSLLSSLKQTFPPAKTWKCSKPSTIHTSGGSQGQASPARTRILQLPPSRPLQSLPSKMIVHSERSSASLVVAGMMALIAGSTFSSSSSSKASNASSNSLVNLFKRSSLAINTQINRLQCHYPPASAATAVSIILLMKGPAKEGSKQILQLPHIRPSRSLPAIRPLKEFDLRCVNIPMKPYNPSNDKFLSQYFERQIRIRTHSSEPLQKSMKTQPATDSKEMAILAAKGGGQRKQKRLVTEQNRTQAVKEVSRQDFNNFLQTMRQRVANKFPK